MFIFRVHLQNCHCGKDTHDVLCGSQESFVKSYACDKICSKLLECKNHTCEKVCHEGKCEMCALQPALVTHCPCGKKRLVEIPGSKPRVSCTDEIQTCNLICQKLLLCGPEGLNFMIIVCHCVISYHVSRRHFS